MIIFWSGLFTFFFFSPLWWYQSGDYRRLTLELLPRGRGNSTGARCVLPSRFPDRSTCSGWLGLWSIHGPGAFADVGSSILCMECSTILRSTIQVLGDRGVDERTGLTRIGHRKPRKSNYLLGDLAASSESIQVGTHVHSIHPPYVGQCLQSMLTLLTVRVA